MRLEQALELRGVGADKAVDLLAVLEKEEGGNGADAEFLGNFGNFVDVKLDKVHLVLEFIRVGVLFQDGSNGLARRAPVGVRVDNDDLVVCDGLTELVGGLDNVDSHGWTGNVEASVMGGSKNSLASNGCDARGVGGDDA